MSEDRIYEMLWNCAYCGTEKLLGLTHRHCPACGAVQDASARYFPDEADRIAVEDHVYVGADRSCAACTAPASAAASFCPACGCGLEDGKPVAAHGDASRSSLPAEPNPGLPRLVKLGAAMAVLCVIAFIGLLSLSEETTLEVAHQSWARETEIERYGPQRETQWCSSMPSAAYDVTRSREVKSHRQVADGESCTMQRNDLADGTYRERRVCTPRYKQVPEYADRCRYSVDRWAASHTVKAGDERGDAEPFWPEAPLERSGSCLGCEREGKRSQRYSLHFRHESEEVACDVEEGAWRAAASGDRWKSNTGVLLGGIRCSSLASAEG